MEGYISRTNQFAKGLIKKELILNKHNAIYDYEFQKALNWFRVNNPEAYYMLLD